MGQRLVTPVGVDGGGDRCLLPVGGGGARCARRAGGDVDGGHVSGRGGRHGLWRAAAAVCLLGRHPLSGFCRRLAPALAVTILRRRRSGEAVGGHEEGGRPLPSPPVPAVVRSSPHSRRSATAAVAVPARRGRPHPDAASAAACHPKRAEHPLWGGGVKLDGVPSGTGLVVMRGYSAEHAVPAAPPHPRWCVDGALTARQQCVDTDARGEAADEMRGMQTQAGSALTRHNGSSATPPRWWPIAGRPRGKAGTT